MSEQNMIANRYMVVTSLGSGGMADVFLAIDTILNREVAVKVLRGESGKDPVALLRFQREASAISKLHHPNVVEVYDIGEFDGKNYIVMEYVRGKTLKQLIRQRGALDKEEAVSIMKQLVAAVSHAHENNIIHRDIKPQNVLVKDDGTVKITDFGIALAHDSVQLTQSDSVLGSAHYIAPETTRGETATVQIDIYALGIVFYELLTGSVPFTGDNPVQIAMRHMREDIPSVREFNKTVPQSVENIILRATAKNRRFRYENTKDMAFDLDMCLLPEFANVEKVTFHDEDDQNSGTMVFDGTQKTQIPNIDSETVKNVNTAQNKKRKKRRTIIAAIAILALLITGGTAGIYYSGIVEGFRPEQYVNVPNLKGLSEEQAKELLEEYGLELNVNVKEEITDDVEAGLVVKQSPKAKNSVVKGSKVTITISSGKYFVVGDYEGMLLEDAKALLPDYVEVLEEPLWTSEYAENTITEQSLLFEGDKLVPGVSKKIRFKYARPTTIVLQDYKGSKIETAKGYLESYGITVKLSQEEIPDDIEDATKGVVIRQEPEAGSTYVQRGDNVVTLYYY
ncbi:serine/threonine protein kinase [Breznakia sp. PF5-3]|uniref:Stk1 family PASTA domain-containing Ser/Thr kinase n=1 Tax=unclassified Breznakia TaxID=2623764 RepID=UPI0024059A7B|nr:MULTISPECIES: Stk1 family PASTA domain-containing Ser/Thr kinase [unclassified Breznakia]MDL2276431.1 Stk1 family PASTA domain-containing Ser/Thr kinase [Breznakia sp. OttesenSCG-928-G09]MDF9825584.1 serine/threonine protein kinase [Breznakia sp. PM6-1]MDF9836425.1 serine/threonine protein kinase [Breznakia sp. PF5-3]MDF9838567.1 serine/threonine protein kinase [Breznakia sp. PFB2-8]MDF9860586.1 serine/threonine protein kinase [Breznakia sp. PH5-24]